MRRTERVNLQLPLRVLKVVIENIYYYSTAWHQFFAIFYVNDIVFSLIIHKIHSSSSGQNVLRKNIFPKGFKNFWLNILLTTT